MPDTLSAASHTATDDVDQETDGDEDKMEGERGSGGNTPITAEVIDEATSGFLDKVNSGTINSAQFMPAIVDLPEVKVKKKYRPRKPKVVSSPPPPAPLVAAKKKRKRELHDDSSEDSFDEDEEYRPSAAKQRRRQKSTKRSTTVRPARGANKPPRRTNVRRDSLFCCRYCDFRTETIGMGSMKKI